MERGGTPRTLAELLWRSFMKTGGFVMTALGLAAAFVSSFFNQHVRVSVVSIALVVTVGIIAASTLLHAATVAHAAALKRLPRVRLAKKPPASYRGVVAVLLLDASELFSADILVSIYHVEDEDYEAPVGIGRVTTIQDAGFIQIAVTNVVPEYAALFERVLGNENKALRSLIVKPHVPMSMHISMFGDLR